MNFAYTHRETGKAFSPREVLAILKNSWLYKHELDRAREVSERGSDDECASYLAKLEKNATGRLGQWRWSQ